MRQSYRRGIAILLLMSNLMLVGCQGNTNNSPKAESTTQSLPTSKPQVTPQSTLSATIFDESAAGTLLEGYYNTKINGDFYIAFSDGVLVNRGSESSIQTMGDNMEVYIPKTKNRAFFVGEGDQGKTSLFRYENRAVSVESEEVQELVFSPNPNYFFVSGTTNLYRYSSIADTLENITELPSQFVVSPSGETVLYQLGDTIFVLTIGSTPVKLAELEGKEANLLSVADNGSKAHTIIFDNNNAEFVSFVQTDKGVEWSNVEIVEKSSSSVPDVSIVPNYTLYYNIDGSEVMVVLDDMDTGVKIYYTNKDGWKKQEPSITEKEPRKIIPTGKIVESDMINEFAEFTMQIKQRYFWPVEHFEGCFMIYNNADENTHYFEQSGILHYLFDGSKVENILEEPLNNIQIINGEVIINLQNIIYGLAYNENGVVKETLYETDALLTSSIHGQNPNEFYVIEKADEKNSLVKVSKNETTKMDIQGELAFPAREYDGFKGISASPSLDGVLLFTKGVENNITGSFIVNKNEILTFEEQLAENDAGYQVWSYMVMDNGRFFYGKNDEFNSTYSDAKIYFFNGKEIISVLDAVK